MATGTDIEIIEHTADISLRVRAGSAGDAFCALAERMFGLIVDREQVRPEVTFQARVEAEGWKELLVAWLEELLYRLDAEDLLVRDCRILEIDDEHVIADLTGEHLDLDRHETQRKIQAVMDYRLNAEQTPNGFFAQVMLEV